MFSVRGPKPPFHIRPGRQRQKRSLAKPVARNQPKIKFQEGPGNGKVLHTIIAGCSIVGCCISDSELQKPAMIQLPIIPAPHPKFALNSTSPGTRLIFAPPHIPPQRTCCLKLEVLLFTESKHISSMSKLT